MPCPVCWKIFRAIFGNTFCFIFRQEELQKVIHLESVQQSNVQCSVITIATVVILFPDDVWYTVVLLHSSFPPSPFERERRGGGGESLAD